MYTVRVMADVAESFLVYLGDKFNVVIMLVKFYSQSTKTLEEDQGIEWNNVWEEIQSKGRCLSAFCTAIMG